MWQTRKLVRARISPKSGISVVASGFSDRFGKRPTKSGWLNTLGFLPVVYHITDQHSPLPRQPTKSHPPCRQSQVPGPRCHPLSQAQTCKSDETTTRRLGSRRCRRRRPTSTWSLRSRASACQPTAWPSTWRLTCWIRAGGSSATEPCRRRRARRRCTPKVGAPSLQC